MDFCPSVTDKSQEASQAFTPVLLEVVLEAGPLLLSLLCHLSATATVRFQGCGFLGFELFLPLQAVLFSFSLSCPLGLLQPLCPLLRLGHLLSGCVLACSSCWIPWDCLAEVALDSCFSRPAHSIYSTLIFFFWSDSFSVWPWRQEPFSILEIPDRSKNLPHSIKIPIP